MVLLAFRCDLPHPGVCEDSELRIKVVEFFRLDVPILTNEGLEKALGKSASFKNVKLSTLRKAMKETRPTADRLDKAMLGEVSIDKGQMNKEREGWASINP